jgi:hypothetical protein
LCDLWTYAHDHDLRTINDRLVVRRDIDGGKALREAGRNLGVARRQQHSRRLIDVLAQPRDNRRADRTDTEHAVGHRPPG